MVTIKNTKAGAEEIKRQAQECLETYYNMTGKKSIKKYDEDYWNLLPHDELSYKHYDMVDVDYFIAAFESEMMLEPSEATYELEADIHNLSAANNKINPVSAFRVCLKYMLDYGLWD